MSSTEFVIVGGGIGGAVLASLLARRGRKVVVLERNLSPPRWVRPEILWPATMEVLTSLKPREAWEHDAVLALRGVEIHDGRRIVPFITAETLRESGVQPFSTNPNATREALLALGDFELRRGVEVIDLLHANGRVAGVRVRDPASRVESEIEARFTIGDDGAESLVRKSCGIGIGLRAFPLDFLCFDCEWPAALPAATARVWLNAVDRESGVVALAMIPLPGARAAGLVPVLSRRLDQCAAPAESWRRFCATDEILGEVARNRRFPEDFVRVRRSWGHAERYGVEGAILIGDAVHPVSPAGGQGANMAVADARVLAELALVNAPNLCEQYERRRRAANSRAMLPTRVAAALWEMPRLLSPPGALGFRLARYRPITRHFLRSLSTLFL